MNIYLAVIVGTLLFSHALELVACGLTLGSMKPEPHPEFKDVYPAEKYAASQAYTKARRKTALYADTIQLAGVLAFILAGGFPLVDGWVRALGLAGIGAGLAFWGIVGLLSDLLSLPAGLYITFVLEEKFGFNTMTLSTFVADKLKGYALAVAIGGPLAAGVLYLFGAAGPWAWVWAWGFVSCVVLFLQYIAPAWILPWFNKFEPLAEGSLRRRIDRYAEEQRYGLKDIYVMNGSKRSSKGNAYVAGIGNKKRIALFDTLVNLLSEQEITAILAHEVGHAKKGHTWKMTVLSMAKTGVLFFFLNLFLYRPELYQAFGMDGTPLYAGLVFCLLLYSPVMLLAGPLFHMLSRRFEFQADRFAAKTGPGKEDIISGLKKLSVSHLANLEPHPFDIWLHYTHPPVLRRIQAIESSFAKDV